MMNQPKFSILLPVKNGMPYLSAAVESILASKSNNFELVVSDDSSSDGSFQFLSKLQDPRLRVLIPPHSMSMSEHWDWLSTQARGRWQMFIGQDDGLQSDWYELASGLVEMADDVGIRSVVCRRAYFFWPGSESYFSGQRMRYISSDIVALRDIRKDLLASLKGHLDYFELPQMYTTSFFRKDLIEEIRQRFGGRLILGHPQDAYLVAAFSRVEERYLRSERPFSWVGSSTSSAGLAISAEGMSPNNAMADLRDSYREKVEKSKLQPSSHMGDFGLGLAGLYLWAAVRSLLEKEDASEEIEMLPQRSTAVIASLVGERYLFRSRVRNERIRALFPRGNFGFLWAVIKAVGLIPIILAGRSIRRALFIYSVLRSSSLRKLNLTVRVFSSRNSGVCSLEVASQEVSMLHDRD